MSIASFRKALIPQARQPGRAGSSTTPSGRAVGTPAAAARRPVSSSATKRSQSK